MVSLIIPLVPILLWALGGAIVGTGLSLIVLKIIEDLAPSKQVDGKKICILGMIGAGKSTLWKTLGGNATAGDQDVKVRSFVIRYNNKEIAIKNGKDIPGGPEFILKYYEDEIKNSDIVCFLFDADRYYKDSEYQKETRSRIDLVYRKLKKFEKKTDGTNSVIIATHPDLLSENERKEFKDFLYHQIEGKDYKELLSANIFLADVREKEIVDKIIEKIS